MYLYIRVRLFIYSFYSNLVVVCVKLYGINTARLQK